MLLSMLLLSYLSVPEQLCLCFCCVVSFVCPLHVLFVIVVLIHVVSSVLLLNCLVDVAVRCLLPSLNS